MSSDQESIRFKINSDDEHDDEQRHPADLVEALERGRAVPSLRAVWHLATGLEVPFGSLLAHTMLTAAGDPDFRVQRAARGRVIRRAGPFSFTCTLPGLFASPHGGSPAAQRMQR